VTGALRGGGAEPDPRPGLRCIKCGRPVGPDESVCEVCNRAGMSTPATTQMHATIVVAVGVGLALMAIWAGLSQRGGGPYLGSVLDMRLDPPDGVMVSASVENQGTNPGRARCDIEAQDAAGSVLRSVTALSPEVAPGASVTFEGRLPGLTDLPRRVTLDCR